MYSQDTLNVTAATAAKSLQSCPTLCDPTDGSPPGPAVPGILQARTLEWVAISFPNASKWKMKVKPLSRVRLFSTPWAAAYQAPLSIGFSRQEYWSGVPSPFPFPTGILIRSVILRATNCTEKIKYNWTGCLSFAWFVQRGFASHNFGNSSVTTDFVIQIWIAHLKFFYAWIFPKGNSIGIEF